MSAKFIENLELAMERLHKQGAFLTVKSGDKLNTMTISWGSIGYEWSKPVFKVLVRKSRYTHELIENSDEFTVTIPTDDSFKSALALCGSKSGRDIDKFEKSNIKTKSGKSVGTPVIEGKGIKYECKILFKQEMDESLVSDEIKKGSYAGGDYHTFYFGEIVECYKED